MNNVFKQLKPEAFCALLLDIGYDYGRINLVCKGSFRRSFRSEIDNIAPLAPGEEFHSEMELVLNRDGIYDRLPEGVFHQSKGNSRTLSVAEMVAECRRYRKEEKLARKFFQPLEQELFRCGVLQQCEELDLMFQFSDGALTPELRAFWELGPELPKETVIRLARIMPWIKHITGSLELTGKALAIILNKPVSVAVSNQLQHEVEQAGESMGSWQLGIDTVVGSSVIEPAPVWNFTIGAIGSDEIVGFMDGYPYGKLLQRFEELFIPITIDAKFSFSLAQEAVAPKTALLGYSLVL